MHMVTGASGLVGAHLLMRLLGEGRQVRALYRSEKSRRRCEQIFAFYGEQTRVFFTEIDWVQGDLLDLEGLADAMDGVKYVYHCAALVSFKKADEKALFKTNIEGTKNLVNVCLSKDLKKLCHVSSTAAVGKPFKAGVADEELPWKQEKDTSNYSISKHHAEMEVWRGMEEGLNAVIVNPSIILGPSDWNRGSAELFTKVWNGLKYYTHGSNGFVDARDVAACMVELMKSDITGERFLLCSENLSYKDLFDLIAANLGKDKPSVKVKKWMLGVIWRLEVLRSIVFKSSPLVTRETAQSSMRESLYSNNKIVKAIGFNFISVAQSVKDTASLFLQEVKQKNS